MSRIMRGSGHLSGSVGGRGTFRFTKTLSNANRILTAVGVDKRRDLGDNETVAVRGSLAA